MSRGREIELNRRGKASWTVDLGFGWEEEIRVLKVKEVVVGSFSVSCCFKNCDDGFCWSFIRVYRPMLKLEREDFWSELGDVRGLWSDPWCMAGDFNMIKFPFKHSRGGRLSSTMRRFLEVIKDLELRDLPLQGGLFTWSGDLNNRLKSRIDRFSHL